MSLIPQDDLRVLNADVKAKGTVDREHLLRFLSLLPTSDASVIIQEVKSWLEQLHRDSDYTSVVFPNGNIDAVLGDLDSYGRVQPLTIQQFKQHSVKVLPKT